MCKKIVAPCGIDCFNCELYEKNVTEEFRDRIHEYRGIPKELISCKGCADGNQCLFLDLVGKKCKTLECIKEKGVITVLNVIISLVNILCLLLMEQRDFLRILNFIICV